ncbi:hypothetical protein DFH06DRAFT_1348526 [Mycena polygramma]|nr:hypothetical protein DFH06DRAFT_1348526 [Mycena polygramma]
MSDNESRNALRTSANRAACYVQEAALLRLWSHDEPWIRRDKWCALIALWYYGPGRLRRVIQSQQLIRHHHTHGRGTGAVDNLIDRLNFNTGYRKASFKSTKLGRGCVPSVSNGHLSKMKALEGSSLAKPWVLRPNGALVLSGDASPPQKKKKIELKRVIFDEPILLAKTPRIRGVGPPSAIRQDTPRIRVARGTSGATRQEISVGRPREEVAAIAPPPPPPPPPRVPPPANRPDATQVLAAPGLRGWRRTREAPLTRGELWLDEERPPVLAVPKPHHVCSLCLDVKSHPVSYLCGHSNCYVCIRLRLETEPTSSHSLAASRSLPTPSSRSMASGSNKTSHKRKAVVPGFVIPGTVSSVSSRSGDQRRQRTRTSVVSQAAGLANAPPGSAFWAEDLTTSLARQAEEFSYNLGDTSLESQVDDQLDDGIDVVYCHPVRNTTWDRPLQTWYNNCNDEYIGENLRREGRGSERAYRRCAGAHQADNRQCERAAEWRCVDQACLGEVMHCTECIVTAHARLPTHFIEKWNGRRFVRRRNWLQRLGLRIQLNHPPGVICPSRQAAPKDFVLYDVTGVHEINVDFCGCPTEGNGPRLEPCIQFLRTCWWPATTLAPNTCATFQVLRLFQTLNCLGKLSAYDFLRGLEICTNHDGLERVPERDPSCPLCAIGDGETCTEHDGIERVPDRRKPFMYIVRQWREVKRMKRSQRGHRAGGARATKQGELTLMCRACPQPGWNLPDNWENIDPFYRYIYFLFLAQDANFRLSNRSVSTEVADPILGDGFGYFCKREGPDGYKAHIGKHANEQEISNCAGFQAMFMAHTKRVKGLRTTGIGGVTCSRHNMWRANGMGDLQMGERYCNMDFLLLSAVIAFELLWLIVSYDIACQYAMTFWQRMTGLPDGMQLKIGSDNVWWKVPNFHLPPHKRPCHSPYSFHWMWGAGMTHGEGVEQNWSFSNGAAGSTRLMGPGSRQATLEDIFGFHNYDRLLAMHRVLPKRLAVNIKEGLRHQTSLDAFTKGLEEFRAEQVQDWREWVHRWELKQHTTAKDLPFELAEEVTTLRSIQLEIASEEFVCTDDGVEVEREHTPGTFITTGMDLEEVQRRLEIDVHALKDPSLTQKLGFTKRRTALLKRIHKFRQLQAVYMPSLRGSLTDIQKQMFDGNGPQLPEVTRLFMPSEIQDAVVRGHVCAIGLPQLEIRLRMGEAAEALETVRHGLRTRTMTNRYRLRNYTGQGMMTKGQGILRQVNIKIHVAKVRYRYSRAALLALEGHGDWEERLRVLHDDDVRALNERALTTEEKAQNEHWAELGGAIIEGGVARAAGVARGEGAHTLSWIWYTVGVAEEENDERLNEALRVEWCKAYARSRRYNEEVRHLREEMRRTIAFGYTAAAHWDRLAAEELPDSSAELTEGRQAYAAEHADTERVRCAQLEGRWRGILHRADAYLDGNEPVSLDGVVTVQLEDGDELDAEEAEARLEAEEEGDPPQ